MNRRTLLGTAAALGLGYLLLNDGEPGCAAPAAAAPATSQAALKHNVWVWRFDVDGTPEQVLNTLRSSGAGILLKTNDGPDWMSRYDDSPTAINGPQRVRELANFFEGAGVPFHAWCVVHGLDPIGEAQICSEVLNSGARSMIFDLEPPEGGNYWQGDPAAALAIGQELRRLQPNAQLGVAPDARPWQLDAVPIGEFASFTNEILPQSYWQTFNGPTNARRIAELGYHVGPEGVTPELILDATAGKLRQYGLPIRPIGQGTAPGVEWARFIQHAYWLQMDSVSVWRFGTAHGEVWPTLSGLAPAQPPVAQAPAPVNAPAVEAAPAAQPAQAAHAPAAEQPAQPAEAQPANQPVQQGEPVPTAEAQPQPQTQASSEPARQEQAVSSTAAQPARANSTYVEPAHVTRAGEFSSEPTSPPVVPSSISALVTDCSDGSR
jgi:hypothetical protein